MAIQTSSFGFSSKSKFRYDVFLSFRGEDTRKSFTMNLYDALRKKGINAFIDDKKLGKGERIAPALLKAIEKSRISIIVISANYATSTWCLDELAHIMWCKEEKNQVVMPVFYKVDPMDIQYQRNSFGEAMAAHEHRFRNNLEKVQKWRSALFEVASLQSAWLFEDGNECGCIESIVEDAFARLPPKRFHNVDHVVGLEPRLDLNETHNSVCMLGIYGIGGIGKTTLAKAIYNSIFYHFEGACFLFDVRETSKKYQGVVHLQQTLLSEILEGKKMKFGSGDEGISKIKHRLSHKKVLLVLDDVEEDEQLEKLAGGYDWFGCGSKIIITTRNKQLLVARNIKKTYQMKELNERNSLELFCWHAFRMSQPPKGYKNMCIHVIRYVYGLPLALKLIGSNLAHKSIEEWRDTLKQYDQIPDKTIHHVLKISYDCLQDGAKRIFLDIACFFSGETLEFVEEILGSCYYGTRFYIEVLVDKSLITIAGNIGHLHIHDLIKKMGKEIVRQEAPSNPSRRSRLCYYKDVIGVLQKNLGENVIEGIILDPPQREEVKWNGLAFEKMNNLRILIIRNTKFLTSPKHLPNSLRLLDWEEYPSMTLPPEFSPPKLVCFKLCRSLFKFEEPLQNFEYVTYMNLSECEFIREIPDMSQFQNLKTLNLGKCHNLIRVHDSVGYLCKLIELNVSDCTKLKSIPSKMNMPSLQELTLTNCKSLEYFPHAVGNMDSLARIFVEGGSAIKELPPSVGNLSGLEDLIIHPCESLRELPNSLLKLQNLKTLSLQGMQCDGRNSLMKVMQHQSQESVLSFPNLVILDLSSCGLLDEDLHVILTCIKNVQALCIGQNDFESLPKCIKECAYLDDLDVRDCKKLRDIPELPSTLQKICSENCTSLTEESIGHLWSQAKKGIGVAIWMPATIFPDWLDHHSEGGKLSFRVRGNFPHVVIAFEAAKETNTRSAGLFEAFISVNGCNKMPWLESDVPKGLLLDIFNIQGHALFLGNLDFSEQQFEGLNKVLDLDWNEVEIQVTCDSPDISISMCGVYVDKLQTNKENVQFKSPLTSRTSLKQRAIASPSNHLPKKLLRKFGTIDKGKTNNTKKRKRRTKPHQSAEVL